MGSLHWTSSRGRHPGANDDEAAPGRKRLRSKGSGPRLSVESRHAPTQPEGCGEGGGCAHRDRLAGAQRSNGIHGEPADRGARPRGRRCPRVPGEPCGARAQDEPVVHDRDARPRHHEPVLPADGSRRRGWTVPGGIHARARRHRQRPREGTPAPDAHARASGRWVAAGDGSSPGRRDRGADHAPGFHSCWSTARSTGAECRPSSRTTRPAWPSRSTTSTPWAIGSSGISRVPRRRRRALGARPDSKRRCVRWVSSRGRRSRHRRSRSRAVVRLPRDC